MIIFSFAVLPALIINFLTFLLSNLLSQEEADTLKSIVVLSLFMVLSLIWWIYLDTYSEKVGVSSVLEVAGKLASISKNSIRVSIISSIGMGFLGVYYGILFRGFWVGFLIGLLMGILHLALRIGALIRIDSYLLGALNTFFPLNSLPDLKYSKFFSSTWIQITYLRRIVNKSFSENWTLGTHNINHLVLYSRQTPLAIGCVNKALFGLSESDLLVRLDQLCRQLADWEIIKYCSASLVNAFKVEFWHKFIPNLQRRGNQLISLRLDTPPRAAAAGFWYLHEGQPAQAAQAFAVVRNIRHGGEMYGLASLLALFEAAENAEQIAAIELPELPPDRTLRPQTWEAIRRFYHVISDTKTAQASVSRAARAFATNRALGELQHILEYEADLPEAERSLMIEIAKTWQNALLEITAAVGEIDLTQPVRNPYVIGDPVEGDLFVGRDDIMRQLQELWLMGNHLQSVVLYGHRRMGKTSILRNVSQVLGSGLRVAYVNLLQSAGAENISDVLLAISDQVAAVLPIDPPRDADMVAQPARTFQRFFRRAIKTLREGEGLIIALDEFEKIEELIAAGKLGNDFMAYLRGLVQDSPRVGFAFAGLHTLEEMSADYFQPFFASVIPIKVDFFKQATVQALLPNPGGDFPLDYDFDALDLIWHLTAGQPYLTQLIGFQLVRRYNDQVFERQQPREAKFTVADVQAVVSQPEFFAQGKPYFAGVWAQAGHDAPGQHNLLTALAPYPDGLVLGDLQTAAGLDSATFSAALDTLEGHDVVRLSDGSAQIIVEMFRRWVSDRVTN